MADNVNKSKMPPMNGGFGASEIEKIGAQTYSIPQKEQELRDRASLARTQIDSLNGMPSDLILGSKRLTKMMSSAPNTLTSAQSRIESSINSRLERSNIQAANVIGREYSERSINSRVRDMYESPSFQNQAMSMMNVPYESLAGKRSALSGQIEALGAQSAEAAGSLFTKRGPRKDLLNTMVSSASQADVLVREMASIDIAMKTRRQAGTDPLSRFEKLNATGSAATELLSAKSLGEELRSGNVNIQRNGESQQIKSGNIYKALEDEANILKNALASLASAAKEGAGNLDDLRKKAEESAENFDKLQKASGGGGGRGASIAQWAGAAGGIFNAVGNGIQQIAVNQQLGRVSNIAGYAGIENQKYDMYKSARGGDVASQMLLSHWGQSEDFGKQLYTGQKWALGAYGVAGGLQAAAGAGQISEALVQKANPLAYAAGTSTQNTAAALAGAQNVAQGLSQGAVAGSDLYYGVSTNAAAQQGIQAHMAAQQALLKIPAEQLQSFRNLSVGLGTTAIGMGRAGGAFIEQNTSAAGIKSMIDSRMSPEQFAQLSQQGVAGMGSMFNTSQIHAARGLERSGFGSATENMQRMTLLAQAGANNPQAGLASVIESAMTKGLDSSRALNLVAENTAAMVQSSTGAAMGLDTTAITASMLVAGVNKDNPNKEFALQRAATARELARGYETNTDVSFSGMVNTASISKATGLSGVESIIAGNLSAEDLRTMRGPNARGNLLKQGITGDSGTIDKLIDLKAKAILRGKAGLALGINEDDALRRIKAGDDMSSDKLFSQNAVLSGFKGGGPEMAAQVKALFTPVNSGAGVDVTKAMQGKGGSDIVKSIDDLRTSGFKQLSEQALQATKTMQQFGGALKVLVDMNKDLEKFGAEGGEEKMSSAAMKSAASFGHHTELFGSHVTRLGLALDRNFSKAGLNSKDTGENEVNKMLKQNQKALDKKTSAPGR